MQEHENKKTHIEVSEDDLPLCCPMKNMSHWNSHPRVFLEIEKEPEGKITCPYCSTIYVLKK